MANDGPPFPYGYQAANESTGSVASPLLAGFSFALVGLVLPSPETFRWPDVTLAFLLAAGVAFIGAVQCGFWARQFAVTPEDIKTWAPDYPQGRIHALQRLHNLGFYKWNHRLNWFYRWGILFLLLGVAFAVVPPGDIPGARMVTIGIAALAVLAELSWIAAIWLVDDSPLMLYDQQPDTPPQDVRWRRLRGSPALRRLARFFVPLQRIQLTDEERKGGSST